MTRPRAIDIICEQEAEERVTPRVRIVKQRDIVQWLNAHHTGRLSKLFDRITQEAFDDMLEEFNGTGKPIR